MGGTMSLAKKRTVSSTWSSVPRTRFQEGDHPMPTVKQKSMKLERTVPLLMVSEIERSREFYCDGLGFDIANKWEPDGILAWCWVEQGGAALMLQQAGDEDPPPETCGKGVTFYFICDDADVVYGELQSRGVQATKPAVAFYGMNQTFVTDPDGYRLCFENQTDRDDGT